MTQWIVDPARAMMLNLRESTKPATIIAVLPAGTKVKQIGTHPDDPTWWEVEAELSGQTVTGFLHGGYLTRHPAAAEVTSSVNTHPPACDLAPKGNRRTQDWGRARPLDEGAMPRRDAADPAQTVAIIRYISPDSSSHMRYLPTGSATYCNIYAYDVCRCMGAYLPRVWWMDRALADLAAGQTVPIHYAQTVRELNANALHDWFEEYGAGFGWFRVFSANDLQDAANDGRMGIIVAKRKDESRSGHIAAVVPEHGVHVAKRNGAKVLRPVMSQAGSSNYTAKVPSNRWWLHNRFKSFGFWVHD